MGVSQKSAKTGVCQKSAKTKKIYPEKEMLKIKIILIISSKK